MLTPPLLLLRRIKVPRVLAVVIVVGIGFRHHLRARLAPVARGDASRGRPSELSRRAVGEDHDLAREHAELAGVAAGRRRPVRPAEGACHSRGRSPWTPAPEVGSEADRPDDQPIKVEVREREPTGLELYQRIAGTLLPPLATAGIVLLFVVFILLQREDLRDRLIRLVGSSDLQRATTTLNDAATRLEPLLSDPDSRSIRPMASS